MWQDDDGYHDTLDDPDRCCQDLDEYFIELGVAFLGLDPDLGVIGMYYYTYSLPLVHKMMWINEQTLLGLQYLGTAQFQQIKFVT